MKSFLIPAALAVSLAAPAIAQEPIPLDIPDITEILKDRTSNDSETVVLRPLNTSPEGTIVSMGPTLPTDAQKIDFAQKQLDIRELTLGQPFALNVLGGELVKSGKADVTLENVALFGPANGAMSFAGMGKASLSIKDGAGGRATDYVVSAVVRSGLSPKSVEFSYTTPTGRQVQYVQVSGTQTASFVVSEYGGASGMTIMAADAGWMLVSIDVTPVD